MDIQIDYADYLKRLIDWAVVFTPKLLLSAFIAYIGFKLVAKLSKLFEAALHKSNVAPDFISFLGNIVDVLLKVGLVLICISILGVEMSSLVALIAAAGFAVGLALQGFLGNFASGLTIVFFKPYKIGDWVSIADTFGKVKSIQIFNTILTTPGDKTIVIPNGKVTDGAVINFSTEGKLRLEIQVTMPYEDSFPRVKEIITETLLSCVNIIKEPTPIIGIESFGSHNLNITIRPYVHPDNYWKATFEVNEKVKEAFAKNNVKIAYSEGIELGKIGL
jgi:small conductance mechanosensitive channel